MSNQFEDYAQRINRALSQDSTSPMEFRLACILVDVCRWIAAEEKRREDGQAKG